MADLKEKTYVEDVDRSVYDIRDAETTRTEWNPA